MNRRHLRPDTERLEPRALRSGLPGGYTPNELRRLYGFDAAAAEYGPAAEGQGVTIAVVSLTADPAPVRALDRYSRRFGLPAPDVTIDSFGAPATPEGWLGEECLDLEAIHAVLPLANIVVVAASEQYGPVVALLDADLDAAQMPGVSVVSNSWGLDDPGQFPPDFALNDVFAAASSTVFVASSGDNGAGDVEYPASSPVAIAVGGTAIHGGKVTTWVGSGWSSDPYQPAPPYQVPVSSSGDRRTPDVSMLGAHPGLDVRLPGSVWREEWGTSLAAPLFAAVVGSVDGVRASRGESPLGTARLLAGMYGTIGTPGWSVAFTAVNGVEGYDPPSGLGSPDVPGFIRLFA